MADTNLDIIPEDRGRERDLEFLTNFLKFYATRCAYVYLSKRRVKYLCLLLKGLCEPKSLRTLNFRRRVLFFFFFLFAFAL